MRMSLPTAGFTLIEMLAVLLLTGLLVAGVTTVTGQWLVGWNRGAAKLQGAEIVSLALDRIASDAAASLPMSVSGAKRQQTFAGTPQSMIMVRPGIESPAASAMDVVQLATTPNGGLVRTRMVHQAGQALPQTVGGAATEVLPARFRVRFEFRDGSGRWQAEWRNPQSPDAVRVTVMDQNGSQPVSTLIPIRATVPAGCAQVQAYANCRALAMGQVPGQFAATPGQNNSGQNNPAISGASTRQRLP